MDVIEVEDQNMYGPESNFEYINEGGNMRQFALPLVRDQILTDPKLNFGANTFRDNIGSNLSNDCNDQNLPGLNLA